MNRYQHDGGDVNTEIRVEVDAKVVRWRQLRRLEGPGDERPSCFARISDEIDHQNKLEMSAHIAHLGEFQDIQCSLHDALYGGTSGWRKGITQLLHPTEDAEDSGRDDFGRLGHQCSG